MGEHLAATVADPGAGFWIVFLVGMAVGGLIVALAIAAHRDHQQHLENEALRALKRIVIGVQCGWPKEHVALVAEHAIDKIEHHA